VTVILFRSFWFFFFALQLAPVIVHAESISAECLEFLNSLPVEFRHHGVIKIPLNPEDPSSSATLKLFYWGNFNPAEDKTPIIYINGGPGLSSENIWKMKFSQALSPGGTLDPNEFKFVFFNQRGLGCNDQFPDDLSRLVYYGSRHLAYDVEALRKHIVGEGGRAVILGQSYGSTAAFYYHQLFPLSPTTVAATGTVGAARDILVERLINQARTLEMYFAKFPEDRARLQSLRNLITDQDCMDTPAGLICGPVLVDALASLHLMREDGSKMSRLALHEYLESHFPRSPEQRPHTEIVNGLRNLLFPAVEFVFKSPTDTVLAIHDFIEYLNITGIRPADGSKTAREGVLARGLDPDAPLISELRLNEHMNHIKSRFPLPAGIDQLAVRVAPDIARAQDCAEALIADPNRPFLIFAAKDDPLAPPHAVSQLVEQIILAADGNPVGNLTYRVLERGGHALDLDAGVLREIVNKEKALAGLVYERSDQINDIRPK
jgi:pimeloyl-ACP methyl ester carboxylesterase